MVSNKKYNEAIADIGLYCLSNRYKFKKLYCLEISIALTLSNPKLGNPDVINRLDELTNKCAADNSGRRLSFINAKSAKSVFMPLHVLLT